MTALVLILFIAMLVVPASLCWGLCFSEAAQERRAKDVAERLAARRRRRERVREDSR